MRISAYLLAFVLFAFPAHAEKLKVIASFSILGDMTQHIAGNDIDLKTLVGPNSDAHVYEPTPADAKAVANADLVIINGLGFEGWLMRLIESSDYKGPVIIATQGITPLSFHSEGMAEDPHAWQSLPNSRIYVANILAGLLKADPTHADDYRARAERYLMQINALDSWVRRQFATIPIAERKAITSHDAFQYFAKTYGVTFLAPLGMSTESEASAADIAHLIDQIRADHIHALFMENIADPRLIRQLETDGGAVIGGTLYSDALSPPGGPAATYLDMFRHNVTELTNAMRRTTP